MIMPQNAMLLRIFIGENDRSHEGRPLYEAIVLKARDVHLAGATVLRGPMGFGHASRLHTNKILRLSEDLPPDTQAHGEIAQLRGDDSAERGACDLRLHEARDESRGHHGDGRRHQKV